MHIQAHPGVRMRNAVTEAIEAVEAFKRRHEKWFTGHRAKWVYDTAGHRASQARFDRKMRTAELAVTALRDLQKI